MAAEHVRQHVHGTALAHWMLNVTSGGVMVMVFFLFSVLTAAAALKLLRIFNSAPAMTTQDVVIKVVIMVGRDKMKLNWIKYYGGLNLGRLTTGGG